MTVALTPSAPLPSAFAAGKASSTLTSSPAPAQSRDAEQLREVAQKFEAIFLRQMLASARNSSLGDNDLFSSQGEESFAEMRDAHFADLAASSGMLGFGAAIEKQLAAHIGIAHSAPQAAPGAASLQELR